MNTPLKQLTSEVLLSRTKALLEAERRATLALIEHLKEIYFRRLYAKWGFASMWEFCTKELGMSEGAAQRRLQAMKLVRDVPEAKVALETGKLSLSNAAKLQSFRDGQKKAGGPVSDPKELLKQVESLSQRECEAMLYSITPTALPQERDRVVSAKNEHELRIVVSAELHEKISRIRGLLAHARPEATYAELLEYMANETLGLLEKKKGIVTAQTQGTITAAAIVEEKESRPLPVGKRVALPVLMKRSVFARSQGQCEFMSQNGRRCSSRYRLEIDHITPLALGGANSLANIRILCREHNSQQAVEKLGRGQVDKRSLFN